MPNALRLALNNCVVPHARTDGDGAGFRAKEWKDPQLQATLTAANERLATWFKGIPLDAAVSSSKLGMAQCASTLDPVCSPRATSPQPRVSQPAAPTCPRWVSLLEGLNAVGSFTSTTRSDVVGDTRAGTVHQCRLSIPQAKAAFMASQKQAGGAGPEATLLGFDELLECVARCGVDK